MTLRLRLQCKGDSWTIYSLDVDGRDRVREFLAELKRKNETAYFKTLGNIQFVASQRLMRNKEKFKNENGLITLKEHQIRLYGFTGAGFILVLVEGDIKKEDAADPKLLKRVHDLKKEFEAENKRGKISVIGETQ